MIDEQWFALVRCLTDTQMAPETADSLVGILGIEEEVLPYLLLRTNAFANWPQARGTFRQAVRAVVRPKASARPLSTSRGDAGARAAFAAATAASITGSGPSGKAAALLREARAASSASRADPHVFIASAAQENGE